MKLSLPIRYFLVVIALAILFAVFLFQRVSLFQLGTESLGFQAESMHPYLVFVINKTIRLAINDLACMLLIISLFQEKKYVILSFYVFLFELLILLPVYFVIKLGIEGDTELSSPLLSQFHRLIINPTLMIVLIISFFYQRFKARQG